MSDGYAGDVTPKQAWEMLSAEPGALLIDVRTQAEFNYVGVTDLSPLAKQAHGIPWKTFPGMTDNPDFADCVSVVADQKDQALLFICRSGVRSIAAAQHMTARGYTRCYNVLGGFEGDKDDNDHRGTVNGWKVDGLPWRQN